MKKLYTLTIAIFLAFSLGAQTVHEVEVFNFGFEPATLTIEPGDIVEWTNTEGFHNVAGNQEIFPENPETFGNSLAAAPWTYSFTFTLEGTYNYRCDQHPAQMQGAIIVSGSASSATETAQSEVSIYPSPAENEIRISGLEEFSGSVVLKIFDITGKLALKQIINPNEVVDISKLKGGVYLYNIFTPAEVRLTGKLLVK